MKRWKTHIAKDMPFRYAGAETMNTENRNANTTLPVRPNDGLGTHPKAGEVWIGNKKRTVFEVTEQWIYYRVTGNERTKRCRKATWRTWRIKYAAYVSNSK